MPKKYRIEGYLLEFCALRWHYLAENGVSAKDVSVGLGLEGWSCEEDVLLLEVFVFVTVGNGLVGQRSTGQL